jgi:hypothetical protein
MGKDVEGSDRNSGQLSRHASNGTDENHEICQKQFVTEDGGIIFLRNVYVLVDCTALFPEDRDALVIAR